MLRADLRAIHLLRRLHYFVDRALHVESLLRNVVILPFHNAAETLHRVGDLHIASGSAGELLGHKERLRQELLDLSRASDRHFLILAKFVDTQNGDDVLQIFVSLQRLLDHLRHVVMILSHNPRIKNTHPASHRPHPTLTPTSPTPPTPYT